MNPILTKKGQKGYPNRQYDRLERYKAEWIKLSLPRGRLNFISGLMTPQPDVLTGFLRGSLMIPIVTDLFKKRLWSGIF
jgi:hypothetical protein